MTQDLSRMSNQERIALLGTEEASKYHGPYRRRDDEVDYLPACTTEGSAFYFSQIALKEEAKKKGEDYKILPCPREFVIKATSTPRRKQKNLEILG